MPSVSRKTLVAIALPLAVALVAGCGGSDNGTGSRSKPAPAVSEFPSAQGKTLRQIVLSAGGGQGPVVSPAAGYFHLGTNRFPFGVFTTGRQQITNAPSLSTPLPGAGSTARRSALPGADRGPHHQPSFQAKTTADDPGGRAGRVRLRHPLRQARAVGVRRPDQERRLLAVQPAALRPTRSATTRCRRSARSRPPSTRSRRARSRTSRRSTRGSRPTTCTATTSRTSWARSRSSCSSRPRPSARAASAARSPTSRSR